VVSTLARGAVPGDLVAVCAPDERPVRALAAALRTRTDAAWRVRVPATESGVRRTDLAGGLWLLTPGTPPRARRRILSNASAVVHLAASPALPDLHLGSPPLSHAPTGTLLNAHPRHRR
jgi:hypothetical protein